MGCLGSSSVMGRILCEIISRLRKLHEDLALGSHLHMFFDPSPRWLGDCEGSWALQFFPNHFFLSFERYSISNIYIYIVKAVDQRCSRECPPHQKNGVIGRPITASGGFKSSFPFDLRQRERTNALYNQYLPVLTYKVAV
ncbi:hypothetical protein M413DRAFT_347676 [Hebeloma cylindrosporum]|uniref:Uncharacterized protein n=1 Tax=Hebeloma cylindrosporum TaxID=76867 RepID=A0A0C3BVY3_HEBCY|nr:hypothetical protein M413DRAFT_347676 [Hebeloma cylindrosporum h7]